MKKSLVRTALLLACLALPASRAAAQEASPTTSNPTELRQQLWNLINNGSTAKAQTPGQLAADPYYRRTGGEPPPWRLFPALPSEPADAYRNRRLGLPVHGRWVTTYVNAVAFGCIHDGTGCATDPGAQERRLLPGSILVKENYPNVATPRTVAQRATPGVITVMWKPFAGYCGSQLPYNAPRRSAAEGPDCFGGEWLYAFYILQNRRLDEQRVAAFDRLVTSSNNGQSFCINCHAPAFRADYLRGLLSQWRAPVQAAATAEASPAEPPAGGAFCDGDLELSPWLPTDVPLDPLSIPSPARRQRMFDCFSWRSFIALNWPGSWGDRGEPDRDRRFGDFGADDDAPAVWQTYRATWELFQPALGSAWTPPARFNGPRPAVAGKNCPGSERGLLTVTRPVVTMIAKSRAGGLGEDLGNETGQAFAGQFGTVSDQNGVLARYEVSMNAAEFDYLVGGGFAANANLTPAGPRGAAASFPDGSVEVKAAWKELCLDPTCKVTDDPRRYFSREVLVYDEATDSCEPEPKRMGLIGLHIAQKTHRAPQWIWSTFEQIDNVPRLPADQVDPAIATLGPRFNDPACRAEADGCFARPFLVGKGLDPNPCCPNAELNRFPPPFGFFTADGAPTPNQLTRLDPIAGSGLNQEFQQLFAAEPFADTPWRFYVLVDTQWPLNGRDPGTGQPNARRCAYTPGDGMRTQQVGPNCYTLVPEDLRNSVIESYMADYYNDAGGVPVQASNRSCMGCHGDAGADFSYIFLDAVEQRVPLQSAHGGTAP